MLTQQTAKAMQVKDRLNPEQSIQGGARYLARMLERLPDSIRDDDRLWFALAAYNLGMGHLEDARSLARRLNRDPDSWLVMTEVLPLLSQQRYFKDLPQGYARGVEPVRYVERIRNYWDVIEHMLDDDD